MTNIGHCNNCGNPCFWLITADERELYDNGVCSRECLSSLYLTLAANAELHHMPEIAGMLREMAGERRPQFADMMKAYAERNRV